MLADHRRADDVQARLAEAEPTLADNAAALPTAGSTFVGDGSGR